MGTLATVIKIFAVWESGILIKENIERHHYYNMIKEHAESVGKPLLMVGMPRFPWQPQQADVIIDVDPNVETIPNGEIADVMNIPYPDIYFGGAYVAHVLEHMYSIENCERAINECVRVADTCVFLCPSPYNIVANFFLPSHHLRLWFDQVNNRIKVTDNRYNTGLGIPSYENKSKIKGKVSQAFVATTMPEIIKEGSAYII